MLFLQATAVQRAASCPDERARASMWHAGPRIGDGYRKLSLTPAGVPNEGGRASLPRGGAQTRTGQTPPPANQMMNWLFKYYVTALPGGSAPPP